MTRKSHSHKQYLTKNIKKKSKQSTKDSTVNPRYNDSICSQRRCH